MVKLIHKTISQHEGAPSGLTIPINRFVLRGTNQLNGGSLLVEK
ncbi:hypothetical protein V7157_06620 [Neobacillus drentensis]